VTRPIYDPMRAPAPRFPRARLARVHDDAQLADLAAAYDGLDYAGRIRFVRRVTAAPDELLLELGEELTAGTPAESPGAQPTAATEAVAAETPAPPPAAPDAPPAGAPASPPSAPEAPPEPTPAPETPAAAPATAPAPEAAPAPEPAAEAPSAPEPAPAPEVAVPPQLPVPPDQLAQLPAAQLRNLAGEVGVDASGRKPEIAARIAEKVATAEQPAVTPEQISQAETANQPPAPDAADGQGAVETADGTTATGEIPADAASAPQTSAEPPAPAETPAPAPEAASDPLATTETPAAPAAGTTDAPTEGTAS